MLLSFLREIVPTRDLEVLSYLVMIPPVRRRALIFNFKEDRNEGKCQEDALTTAQRLSYLHSAFIAFASIHIVNLKKLHERKRYMDY